MSHKNGFHRYGVRCKRPSRFKMKRFITFDKSRN